MRWLAVLVVLLLGCSADESAGFGIAKGETDQACSCSAGETGPRGEQGPAGLDGRDGADGIDGAAGPKGLDGEQGPSGEVGPAGEPGPAGAAGVQGLTGSTGATGPAGSPGASGATGPAGADGSDGADGVDGLPRSKADVYETTASFSLASGQTFEASALCSDVSDLVIAGGCSLGSGFGQSATSHNHAIYDDSPSTKAGWYCRAWNYGSQPLMLTAHAYCVDVP